jgi:hypothetical protein
MRVLLLAVLLPASMQDLVPAPACPFNRVVPIEITATDPMLEGHGPSKRVDQVVEFSGTLHVWTKVEGDLDTFLRVEDASGKPIAEDDDSGGKPTPYLKLEVEPATRLTITVASSRPGTNGLVELQLVAAPETAATRAGAESAELEIAAIRDLRRAKDLDAARERADALLEKLAGVEGALASERLALQASLLSRETEALGSLRSTERARRWVLSHRIATLPRDHRDLRDVRLLLARTIYLLGNPEEARDLIQAVVDSGSRTLPDDHPDMQVARQNLAVAIEALGDLKGAEALERQVLEARSRTLPNDDPALQMSRNNLAATLAELGDLPGARALQEEVLEVRSRKLPEDDPDLQEARNNLALTLGSLGELQAARTLLEQVVEAYARTLPDDHPNLQKARGNLAVQLKLLGDLGGARALEEKVLEIRSRLLPDDHIDLQKARLNLAITLQDLGDFEGARVLEAKVLEVFSRTVPDDHPDLQNARASLASTKYSLGDLQGARELEEKVLEVRSNTLPPDHPELQKARLNLAAAMYSLGEVEGARALWEQVLEVDSRTLPADHPDFQLARMNLAVAIATASFRSAQRRPTASEQLSADKARFGELLLAYVRAIGHANAVAIAGSSSRGAEEQISSRAKDLARALSCAEGYGAFDPDPTWCEEAFLASETARNAAIAGARVARKASGDPGYQLMRTRREEASAELARLAETGATVDEFAAARGRFESSERELLRLAARLAGARSADLETDLLSLAAAIRDREALVAYLRYPRLHPNHADLSHERSTDSLCAFILRRSSAEASGPSASGANAGSRLALSRIELGAIEPIESAIDRWRSSLGVGVEPTRGVSVPAVAAGDAVARGEEVRRLVFDPVAEHLSGVERVVVALDDVLHLLPLEALPAGESARWVHSTSSDGSRARSGPSRHLDGRLLGDVLWIEVRCSLLELLHDAENTHVGGCVVVVGNVDYGARAGTSGPADPVVLSSAGATRAPDRSGILCDGPWAGGFQSLAATGEEARRIAEMCRAGQTPDERIEVLEGARASRENFFALAPKARILHVATHGWIASGSFPSTLDPRPLDQHLGLGARMGLEPTVHGMSPLLLCGLALAGANSPTGPGARVPGLVTAEELATLDLSNCELAVLSACDTNVGVRRAGQGVASLQRALHMAGARTVITSLWRVPDEATKDLMVDFYRRLWVEKKPKWQALWEAKLKLRNEKDETGKPKYTTRDWAAWVLTGDPN